jgi:hypothetical protein
MGSANQITETPERVFYVKSRPQNADIIEIVRDEQRVFIGYPPWCAEYDPADMASCVVNLRTASDGWRNEISGYHQAMTTNRRFAQSVNIGWIVAIPRPGDGLCWLAEIAQAFEVINDPPWRSRYLDMRRRLGLERSDEASHVGDVVQSWRISNLVSVPFGRIPRWISYRLLSRQTIGEISGVRERELSAYPVLKRAIDGISDPPLEETDDLIEIERRLLTFVSPAALEHLAVALLQVERPDEMWWHIGGSGDGGSDGLGYDRHWLQSGQVQCKWLFKGSRLSEIFEESRGTTKRILVSLIHGPVDEDVPNAMFWGSREIAVLVKKHSQELSIARSLRICRGV